MKRLRILGLLGLLVLSACASTNSGEPSPEEGHPAPDFELQTLQGAPVHLGDFRGQPVLVNFWATWCEPCKEEMPAIQSRYHKGGFAVLAVDFDESADQVNEFVNELGLDLPVLLDPGGKIQELYRVRGYPTTFFIDADGVIRFFHIGGMSEDVLDDYLSQLGVQP